MKEDIKKKGFTKLETAALAKVSGVFFFLPEQCGAEAFIEPSDALFPQQFPGDLHGCRRFGLHGSRCHRLWHQLPLSSCARHREGIVTHWQ